MVSAASVEDAGFSVWAVVGAGLSAATGVVRARMGGVGGSVGGATALARACRKLFNKACLVSTSSPRKRPRKRARLGQNSSFNQSTVTPGNRLQEWEK